MEKQVLRWASKNKPQMSQNWPTLGAILSVWSERWEWGITTGQPEIKNTPPQLWCREQEDRIRSLRYHHSCPSTQSNYWNSNAKTASSHNSACWKNYQSSLKIDFVSLPPSNPHMKVSYWWRLISILNHNSKGTWEIISALWPLQYRTAQVCQSSTSIRGTKAVTSNFTKRGTDKHSFSLSTIHS